MRSDSRGSSVITSPLILIYTIFGKPFTITNKKRKNFISSSFLISNYNFISTIQFTWIRKLLFIHFYNPIFSFIINSLHIISIIYFHFINNTIINNSTFTITYIIFSKLLFSLTYIIYYISLFFLINNIITILHIITNITVLYY